MAAIRNAGKNKKLRSAKKGKKRKQKERPKPKGKGGGGGGGMDMMEALKSRLMSRQAVLSGKDLDKGPKVVKEGPTKSFDFKSRMKAGVSKVIEKNREEEKQPAKFAAVVKMAQESAGQEDSGTDSDVNNDGWDDDSD